MCIEAQTRLVIQNVERVLQAGGSNLNDVVKVTAHLADMRHRDAFNRVYREMFSAPYPARTTVGSGLDGILVEIDVIAIRQQMSAQTDNVDGKVVRSPALRGPPARGAHATRGHAYVPLLRAGVGLVAAERARRPGASPSKECRASSRSRVPQWWYMEQEQ